MATLFAVKKPAFECAAARAAPASATQIKKVHDRTQGVMHHLKQLMGNTEKSYAPAGSSPPAFDLVTHLFHAVLKEDRLSPLIRVWFARLQLPVMRQALMDPLDFQDQAHPARLLIANVGTYALGLSDGTQPCDALEQEIKRLVLSIEQFSVADRQVFAWANQAFNQYLAVLARRDTASAPTADCEVCQLDQKVALTTQYRVAIRDKLSNQPVQTEIRNFLHDVWAESMAIHAMHKGMDHAETLELKQTAIELIRVNTALLRRKDRSRTIGNVPQLVKKLRQGMALIGLSEAEQDGHIKRIGQNLTDAFLSEHAQPAAMATKAERRSPKRLQRNAALPTSQKTSVEGIDVVDDGTEISWHLWECALVEQQQSGIRSRSESDVAPQGAQHNRLTEPEDYWTVYAGDNL